MLATFVLLTPSGGIVILAALIPLAGLAFAARRERQAREILRLTPPPPASRAARAGALVAVPLLLGLAAMQPALRTTTSARVRTDAQAFFVIDTSRSMLASAKAGAPTRLARAKAYALRIRDAIPQVPAGIATLTDQVIPNLFPNADRNVFANTLDQAVQIEQPPPQTSNPVATSLGAISQLGSQNYFSPAAKRRVVVVLTDAENAPNPDPKYDPNVIAATLGATRLVLVHVWSPNEGVYDLQGGAAETGYHIHPESVQTVAALATATHGRSFGEGSIGSAAGAVQAALGTGPTIVQGRTERTRTLAPYVALLALIPLLFVLPRIGRGLGRAIRVLAGDGLQRALEWKRRSGDYSQETRRPGVPVTSGQSG